MEAAINVMLYLAVLAVQVVIQVAIVVATLIFQVAAVGVSLLWGAISEWRTKSLVDSSEAGDEVLRP